MKLLKSKSAQSGNSMATVVVTLNGKRVYLTDPSMRVIEVRNLFRAICAKHGELSLVGVEGLTGRVTEAWLVQGGGQSNYKNFASKRVQALADQAVAKAEAAAEKAAAEKAAAEKEAAEKEAAEKEAAEKEAAEKDAAEVASKGSASKKVGNQS